MSTEQLATSEVDRRLGAPRRRRLMAGAVAVAASVAGLAAAAAPAAAAETTVDCQVDPSTNIPAEYPDARWYADTLANGGCEIIWNQVVDRLVGDSYDPPGSFSIHWVAEGVGGVAGTEVYLGYKHIQSTYEEHQEHDWGLAYHEFAHVAQGYPNTHDAGIGWVTEGLADWVRYDQGQPPPGHGADPTCGGVDRHYTKGYECAATFLGWIDSNYMGGDHSVIPLLNAAYHYDSPNSPAANLEVLTGETIDDLWSACLADDCTGGDLTAS